MQSKDDTVLEARKSKLKPPPMYKVMLLNDDWQSRRDLPAEMVEDLQLMQQLLGECRDSLWQLKPKQAAVFSEWQTVHLYQTLQTQLAHWHN